MPWWLLPISAKSDNFANLAEVSQNIPSLFLECLSVALKWPSEHFSRVVSWNSRHMGPYALYCWDARCLIPAGGGTCFWGPWFLVWMSFSSSLGVCYQSVSLGAMRWMLPFFLLFKWGYRGAKGSSNLHKVMQPEDCQARFWTWADSLLNTCS